MLVFGLRSTSDDQLSNPNDESHPKMQNKIAAKLSKIELLIFGLRSTSDDRLGDLSNQSHPKCGKFFCCRFDMSKKLHPHPG